MAEITKENLKTFLKEWRVKQRLTQSELSHRTGVSMRTISRIENIKDNFEIDDTVFEKLKAYFEKGHTKQSKAEEELNASLIARIEVLEKNIKLHEQLQELKSSIPNNDSIKELDSLHKKLDMLNEIIDVDHAIENLNHLDQTKRVLKRFFHYILEQPTEVIIKIINVALPGKPEDKIAVTEKMADEINKSSTNNS